MKCSTSFCSSVIDDLHFKAKMYFRRTLGRAFVCLTQPHLVPAPFKLASTVAVVKLDYSSNLVCLRLCSSAAKNDSSASPYPKKDEIDMSKFPAKNIRNFSIIAHVDHGKSTLADRILEITGAISKTTKNEQVLDKLQVERERGITVKAQTASLFYERNGTTYLLNLIDTPGHVDFNFEVSRSLSACQGVVLLVDANQGVQAQTVANFYLAFGADLVVIPVLNKIDLKNAKPEAVAKQMLTLFEIPPETILKISAKHGTGVKELIHEIIDKVPPPSGGSDEPLQALVFDSNYNRYRGVIPSVAVKRGHVQIGDEIVSAHTNKVYEVKEVGILCPDEKSTGHLYAGQVGYLTANIRSIKEAPVGDTLCLKSRPAPALIGFRAIKPMVFAGLYPLDQSQTPALRSAIEKLVLNDPSVTLTLESSPALGQGWRVGYLGLLHMDVFNQRLEQEHDAQVVVTIPSVPYKAILSSPKSIKLHQTEELLITSPLLFPDATTVAEFLEPMVKGTIISPLQHMGAILALCIERRGIQTDSRNLDENTIIMQFRLPLNEIVVDFFDELKSLSSGYASFDYEDCGYQSADLVKMCVNLNGIEVEELTMIVNASRARKLGKQLVERLKDTIPQQQFVVAIQAKVGGTVLARENIKAFRKDVAAKLKYGGDITRRKKLLGRQAEGKKRLRMIGNIVIPRDTFIKVLRKS